MKKKIWGGIALLTIAGTAAINVSLGSKSNGLSDLTLTNIETHAGVWENISDWWNSKVYTCETRDCSNTYSLGFWSTTYYGTYSNCVNGSSYAHCWDCETSCNAY